MVSYVGGGQSVGAVSIFEGKSWCTSYCLASEIPVILAGVC